MRRAPRPPAGASGTTAPAQPKPHWHVSQPRLAQLITTAFLLLAGALVPWTMYLGFSLPPKYNAGHWVLLWTGFDVALIAVLAFAGWAAWFRRQVVASTALVAGTLLLCDAWFDIIMSLGHGDEWVTLATGFGCEIPLAVFFFWLYRRISLDTLAAFHRLLNDRLPPGHLHDAPILFLETRPADKPELSGG
jgi:hypothetical protein